MAVNLMLLWWSPACLAAVFLLGYLVQTRSRNAGWVDVWWAAGVGVTGALYALVGTGELALRLTVAVIYLVWFGRLAWHLANRISHTEEDGRYAALRAWAGDRWRSVFLGLYMMQASWVWIFTLPAWVLSQAQTPPAPLYAAALALVVAAWMGEALADRQLATFKADSQNQGKTCRQGLWRYSRHPNYFFEWLHWFAYPLLGAASAWNLWLWLAPALMFVFLYFITGIPFTERQALRSRGEDYRDYQRRTPMFIPWRPKS
ncbi:predicted membrane protein [Hahella chejuensis KCTC 2396]|uniref:Predicted membrane protein n=1 Tax=Hahella chejuensis (strain KCTC 2396) TaxID=349521 RepID=Q2SQ23_HAHCH|nr:DUF1295 domain-containing protein [Hahella chejuensis]ABC27251.1 predicted membrane protein [Hahella chejuensis KCTC 2396]